MELISKVKELLKKENFEEAKKICEDLLSKSPNNFDALYLLSIINVKGLNFKDAIISLNLAIKMKPQEINLLNLKGIVLEKNNNRKEAIKVWEEILNINSNFFQAYYNIGNALSIEEKYLEALKYYDKAIKINPDYFIALNNRASLNLKLRKYENALVDFTKLISLKKNNHQAHFHKGVILSELGQKKAAVNSFAEAIKIKQDYAEAYYGMAIIFREIGDHKRSLETFKSAKIYKKNLNYIDAEIIGAKRHLCSWDDIDEDLNSLNKEIFNKKKIMKPFLSLSLFDSCEILSQVAKDFSYNFSERSKILNHKKNDKIKLGYFSANFSEHAVSRQLMGTLKFHDKKQFETIGFYFGNKKDDILKKVENYFDHFFDVTNLSDKEIAKISQDNNIDIAIDLMGYTAQNRHKIFQYSCAPIHINYLGYAGTLGSNYMDYIIGDKTVINKNLEKFYSEKIIYLPKTFMPNNDQQIISDKNFSRKEFNIPEDAFVFCCFNQAYKINKEMFNIWIKILKSSDKNYLILKSINLDTAKNLHNIAKQSGVNERIIFLNRIDSYEEHLSRHKIADLFLDTFPYSSHSTCMASIWSGVPVLTLSGQTFASNVASSILKSINLDELVVKNLIDYEKKAVELSSNKEKNTEIKNKIKNLKENKKLFNTKEYTSNLESAFKKIYNNYFLDKKIETIEI